MESESALMSPAALSCHIKDLAEAAGFEACRVARAGRADHAREYQDWLADGCHGDMAWMAREPERRSDPRHVLPGCRSVILLAVNYFPGARPAGKLEGRIARYAWNEDYHDLILPKLKELDAGLRACGGEQRCYTDTGPVLERDFAQMAGLGWNGKSTVQIDRALGTWFFLATVLTTLDVAPDAPAMSHCGSCTRCISACPTHAITGPHRVDARRCISYLTIEHKGSIPVELRPLVGDRIYGCDDCLEVCPWNKFARVAREAGYHARAAVFAPSLSEYLAISDDGFRALFRGSPIKRIKRARFLRNVCVALGNIGGVADMPALRCAAADPDSMIAEHAAWAIARIEGRME